MTYDAGDQAILSVEFTDADGVATDPTTVLVRLMAPNGTVETYTYPTQITNPAVGRYEWTRTLAATGTWAYRWEGSGTLVAAGEGQLVVRPSAFYT